jgi:hypothetical protein
MSALSQPVHVAPTPRDFDPDRPFVVVEHAVGLIDSTPHDVTRWVESSIERLFDMIQSGFFQTVAVDVAVALPVFFERLCEALNPEAWACRAGELVIHGMHSPCGDMQQHTILPCGHTASWLPTIHVVSMSYTDSLDINDYREACQTGFANIRQGRRLITPLSLKPKKTRTTV